MSAPISDADVAALVRHHPDFMCIADSDGWFLWLNDAFEALGWSLDELMAKRFLEFVHPDDVVSTENEMGRLADGATTLQFCNRYACRDGTYRWLEWTARMLDDGRLHGIARDVTDRLRRQHEVERATRQLSLAQQIGRTGSWYVDLEGGQLEWSREVYRIYGVEPSAFTPTVENSIAFYHPDDRQRVSDLVNRAVEEQQPFEFELRLIRADGKERFVQSIGAPEIDSAGRTVGILGVFRDLTDDDRHRRHEELEQFAHAASHDLKEPARTIRCFVDLLLESIDQPTEEQLTFSRFVRSGAERLNTMLDDLREYTRVGAVVESEPVPLAGIVETCWIDLGLSASAATLDCGPLPTVHANPTRMRQVFLNLLQNAVKFAHPERAPAVTIRCEEEQGLWKVFVSDNGVGIPAGFEQVIFAPFRRLDPQRPGSGIGLALVRRIVEGLGGQAVAERVPDGRGATFSVTLPAVS